MKPPVPTWRELPPIPDPEGFASPFAGVSGGSLLVAGGANFRVGRPWNGGSKAWYDRVFRLETPAGGWTEAGRLSRPAAYGLSVSSPDGVVCVGGGNAKEHFVEATLLTWDGAQLQQTTLPALPRPCAFMSGAMAGTTVYVAGGIESPGATQAMATFWALDLAGPERAWKVLPPCPGAARMLAVAATVADTFYFISGVSLHGDANGKPVRTYLRDAYSYHPIRGWQRLEDVPQAVAAAPSPAPVTSDGRVVVVGGDDGARVHLNGPAHPGFPREMLAYDPAANTWATIGVAPFSRATVPTAQWQGHWIIPNGERIPGIRSPEVWALEC